MKSRFKRTLQQLKEKAALFWPEDLSAEEAKLSVIPKLVQTQDQFIAILSVEVSDIDKLFEIVDTARMPANLFLKHLMVLADFGGEMAQRVNREFKSLFPKGRLSYSWNGRESSYRFKRLPISSVLNNHALGVDGKRLLQGQSLSDLHKDVIALLLLGSLSAGADSADGRTAQVLSRCEIAEYLGAPEKLDRFIRQRYLWVSRITGGAKANNLGQLAQSFVKKYLSDHLNGVEVRSNGTLPGVTHRDPLTGKPTKFDIVASRGSRHVAVEVSFQVTTNSVIERKAGQARSRFEQIEKAGHSIAYVIDGAGNFQRENVGVLCDYSHCTVAFTKSELDLLCDFVRGRLSSRG